MLLRSATLALLVGAGVATAQSEYEPEIRELYRAMIAESHWWWARPIPPHHLAATYEQARAAVLFAHGAEDLCQPIVCPDPPNCPVCDGPGQPEYDRVARENELLANEILTCQDQVNAKASEVEALKTEMVGKDQYAMELELQVASLESTVNNLRIQLNVEKAKTNEACTAMAPNPQFDIINYQGAKTWYEKECTVE